MFALRIKGTDRLVRFSVNSNENYNLNNHSYGVWTTNTREYAEKIISRDTQDG